MIILGVDPGSINTGVGIIKCDRCNFELIEFNCIKMNSKLKLTDRLKTIYDSSIKIIKKFKPGELAIETAFYGKNIQSTLKLGQARGVAIIAALNSGMKVYEYSPREIKKSVTGNGSSSKIIVQNYVKRIFDINDTNIFFDSSDALAVALCHFYSKNNFYSLNKLKKNNKKNNNWKNFVDLHPEKLLK